MPMMKLQIPGGINPDLTEYSASGMWHDCENVRFVHGFPHRIGGSRRLQMYATGSASNESFVSGDIVAVTPYDYPDNDFLGTVNQRGIILGTTRRLQVIYQNSTGRWIIPTTLVFNNGFFDDWTFAQIGDSIICLPWRDGTRNNANSQPYMINSPKSNNGVWLGRSMIQETGAKQVPNQARNMLVSAAHGHIIFFGCSEHDANLSNTPAEANGKYNSKHIRWSDPYTFDFSPTDTNRAGDFDLPEEIIAANQTNNSDILVWTKNLLFLMRFVGGNQQYTLALLSQHAGAASKNSTIAVNDEVMWLSPNGWFHYNGVVQEITPPLKYTVLNEIDFGHPQLIFGYYDSRFNEVRWHYKTKTATGTTFPDKYVAMNILTGEWSRGTLGRRCWIDGGTEFDKPLGFSQQYMYEHDDFSKEISGKIEYDAWIESGYIEIEQGDELMHVSEFIPDIRADNDVHVKFTGKKYPNGSEEIIKPEPGGETLPSRLVINEYPITPDDTDKVDLKLRARQLKLRYDMKRAHVGMAEIGTARLNLQPDGGR